MKKRTTLVDPTRWGISRDGRLLAACSAVLVVPFLVVGVLAPSMAPAQEVQSLVHDTPGRFNSLVRVDADTFALAHVSGSVDGLITTFTISADRLDFLLRRDLVALNRDSVGMTKDAPQLARRGGSWWLR